LLGQNENALAAVEKEHDEAFKSAALPIVYWGMGRRTDSDAALSKLTDTYSDEQTYAIAEAYAFRGEKDQAFNWLDRAYRVHDPSLTWLKTDPLVDDLRSDPRFKALLRTMNLPE
jgi:serine/threonine-protein kinase